jgi:hypothetical protein
MMTETTILLILGGLAVLAYYTDLFGWDAKERHAGPARSGLAPALLILAVGLGVSLHFGLVTTDTLLGEYDRGSAVASDLWDAVRLDDPAAASNQISGLVDRIAAGFEALADDISERLAGVESTPHDAPAPPRA